MKGQFSNPVLRLMQGEFDPYNDVYHTGEWLTEFSLEVRGGPAA